MNRIRRIIYIILVIIIFSKKVYAISEDFKFAIDTIGIPRYNAYGDEINEDVYYSYNVFSYGNPSKIVDKNQRWKNSKYGFWTKGGGPYKGSGTRGEYEILGKSYSGALIYNYYFPMDVIPDTTPEKWTFCSYPGAAESWKDKSKYKYSEQLEYMKNQKLMFNDITSRERADNPKYIREYNITANKIGLNKARLDVAATWKTNGMVSTRRNISGVIYSQVYLVKPMAANAGVISNIEVENEFTLSENDDELIIPINYDIKVVNMTGYAKKEHIKELAANLYINGEKVDENSGSKITSVGNQYLLVVTRDKFPPNKIYDIEILNKGYMHTEFVADGLMKSDATKTIKLYVEPKLIIPVKSNQIKILEKQGNKRVVRPLAQTIITNLANSVGFTEAGKHIICKLDLNVNSAELTKITTSIDGEKCIIDVEKKDYKLIIEIEIPKILYSSLYGEYSLRDKYGSFFDIYKSEVGLRKDKPHELNISMNYNNKIFNEKVLFDTLDDYLTNMNLSYSKTILNWSGFNKIQSLEDWIEYGT